MWAEARILSPTSSVRAGVVTLTRTVASGSDRGPDGVSEQDTAVIAKPRTARTTNLILQLISLNCRARGSPRDVRCIGPSFHQVPTIARCCRQIIGRSSARAESDRHLDPRFHGLILVFGR